MSMGASTEAGYARRCGVRTVCVKNVGRRHAMVAHMRHRPTSYAWLMLARCHMGHHAMCRGSDTSTAVLCIVYTRVITISSADSASARVRGPVVARGRAGAGPAARCRLPRTRRSDPRGSGCGLELSIYSRGVYVSAVRCDARWRDARFRSGSSFGCRRGFVTLRKPSCPVNSAVSGLSR